MFTSPNFNKYVIIGQVFAILKTYWSGMETQLKRVLIGVTGRIDSAVAAYLLKKQGFDVCAVSVVFYDTESATNIIKGVTQYSLSELSEIRSLFEDLNIPFYAVDAQEHYYTHIQDLVVACRLSGKYFDAKFACTKMIVDILFGKIEALNADMIATGHYAKLQKKQITGNQILHSSSDADNDQSFLLAGISTQQLNQMIFPLSEMRKSEVEKIGKMLSSNIKASHKRPNIFSLPALAAQIERHIPSSMIKKGEALYHCDKLRLGDYNGIHHFFLGQDRNSGLALNNASSQSAKLSVVQILPRQNIVLLDDMKRLFFTHVTINECKLTDSMNITEPIDVYIQFSEEGKRFLGILYFKNNSNCLVEFSEKIDGKIYYGTNAVIYNGGTGIARILGHGIVQDSFYFHQGYARSLPLTADQKALKAIIPDNVEMRF